MIPTTVCWIAYRSALRSVAADDREREPVREDQAARPTERRGQQGGRGSLIEEDGEDPRDGDPGRRGDGDEADRVRGAILQPMGDADREAHRQHQASALSAR
jgi:hypothetical protein